MVESIFTLSKNMLSSLFSKFSPGLDFVGATKVSYSSVLLSPFLLHLLVIWERSCYKCANL